MFSTLTLVGNRGVTHVHIVVKTHRTVHLQCVNYTTKEFILKSRVMSCTFFYVRSNGDKCCEKKSGYKTRTTKWG